MSVSRPAMSSILTIRPVKFLGDVSYSFYLLHFPVMLTCTSITLLRFKSMQASWMLSLIFTLALSLITYKFIEQPFQKLGRMAANYYKAKFGVPGIGASKVLKSKDNLHIE
jgi:peptidoglycan/LPS O-acetylase OafA/YrhL